ncbi:hypothetical protein AMTR_s00005p00223390 [Amborella trichopoda]|uniref:Uncharacterized protein n=1 Tax=Amborella trichopoda TaxID=13333 RepID=W1PGJ5_AMBTC|nr:hypothetical protein AMTR_s00005p00223390 [Amborella trichopoda]
MHALIDSHPSSFGAPASPPNEATIAKTKANVNAGGPHLLISQWPYLHENLLTMFLAPLSKNLERILCALLLKFKMRTLPYRTAAMKCSAIRDKPRFDPLVTVVVESDEKGHDYMLGGDSNGEDINVHLGDGVGKAINDMLEHRKATGFKAPLESLRSDKEVDIDECLMAFMMNDMGMDFNVPIAIVYDERIERKKTERLTTNAASHGKPSKAVRPEETHVKDVGNS